MNISKILLTGVAVLSLAACGKKDERETAPLSDTSAQAAKVSAGSPLDADYRLKDAEPIDVDALFALMPETSRPTYENASFDDKLGATIVTQLRFADADDGEAVIVERAEFYGVDMEAIDRVRSAEDAGAAAPFETLFQKVRFLNVTTEGYEDQDAEAAITVAGVEFDKLQIRQGGVGSDDDGARFFNAVNIAGIYFRNIKVAAEGDNAPSIVFSAPDLRLVGLGGGKLNAIIANDFEYEMSQTEQSLAQMREAMGPQGAFLLGGPLSGFIAPENQRTTMKSFEWRNIDFSGLLAWGMRDETPPLSAEDLIDLGVMKAADMKTFISGRLAASIKEATMSAAAFTWLAPSDFRVDTKGAVYDFTAYVPEKEEAVIETLKQHGLDKVKGDGYIEWIWNADSGAADFDYVAETSGLADFSLALGFSGLKLNEMAAAQESGDGDVIMSHGAFNNFSLKVADEKALDAIFALSALQMGGTGEDLRFSAPAMIRLSGAQAAQMNGRISGYANALAEFVAKGGTLEINAKPAKPVAFTALQTAGATAPQTLPDVLELEVTHKE